MSKQGKENYSNLTVSTVSRTSYTCTTKHVEIARLNVKELVFVA